MARRKRKHQRFSPTADRKVVVVLGMHRSGTSAMGGALQLLGVNFGERLLPPWKDNEKGYWEHPGIVALHDELLHSLGSRWDDDKPLPSDWVMQAITRDVRSRLIGILERDFAQSSLFGIKDPRMCRLMPLWFPIFQTMRLEPHFVLVLRHPWEVAESLAKRDGIEHTKSYLLWLEHVVEAESATRSYKRAFVCYEEMVDHPVAILAELRKQLDVNLLAPSRVRPSLRKFLAPSLRHHHFSKNGDTLRQSIPSIALDFYETIQGASTSREIGKKMKPLVAQFIRGREIFSSRIHLAEARLALLDHELKEKSEQVVHFQHESEEKSKLAAQFKTEAEERSREAAELKRESERQSHLLERLKNQLETSDARWETLALHVTLLGTTYFRETPAAALFNAAWYLEENPDVAASDIDPLEHYLERGALEGRDPNQVFDTRWYLEKNPDVAAKGVNPLVHYYVWGVKEGCDPHPLFSTNWYLEVNPDVHAERINPLQHYLEHGARENRNPHPLFESRWYLEENPEADGQNPLEHYLHWGGRHGRSPHPLFDSAWYLAQCGDDAAAKADPLRHYLEVGASQGRHPHPLFDSSWYRAQNPDLGSEINPLRHYLECGAREGRDPHPLFCSKWYLKQDPAIDDREINPLQHYVLHGAGDSRSPHPMFDSEYYRTTYLGPTGAKDNPLLHYLTIGWRAGYWPNSQFDPVLYLHIHPDIADAGLEPFTHYILSRESEGRD